MGSDFYTLFLAADSVGVIDWATSWPQEYGRITVHGLLKLGGATGPALPNVLGLEVGMGWKLNGLSRPSVILMLFLLTGGSRN